MSIKRLLKSFKYAAAGFGYAIRHEQNMRIHISVASLIIPFACCYGISPAEWAILALVICMVIFAELVNTAIESLADEVSTEFSVNIMHAKDVAAAGVTVTAIGAVAVGMALFLDFAKIGKTLTYIFTTPLALAAFALIITADILLLIFGGKRKDRNDEKKQEF